MVMLGSFGSESSSIRLGIGCRDAWEYVGVETNITDAVSLQPEIYQKNWVENPVLLGRL
jgi:hypothetical protein